MNNIDLSRISFDGLKESFIEFAKTYPQFTDFEFEGSNGAFLVDMLAYSAYYSVIYQSYALNECFLDTATQRANVVSKAKSLGYTPKSRITANIPIRVELDRAAVESEGVFLPDSLTFPTGTTFSVKILDTDFQFSTLRTYSLFNDSGVYRLDNMMVYEGIPRNDITYFSITKKIELPFSIDLNTLKVTIRGVEWTLAQNGIRYNSDSPIYYVQENSKGIFEIFFGDNVVSARPAENDRIDLFYLESSGPIANAGVAEFEIAYTNTLVIDRVDYTKYLTFTALDKPGNSVDRETIEDVRRNSSYAAVSQNRAVTVKDYVYVIENVFYNDVIRANAWDINDLDDPNDALELGKVNIVCQPRTYRTTPVLSQIDRDSVLRMLSSNFILGGIRLQMIDPVYMRVNHHVNVFYDEKKLDVSLSDIKLKIRLSVRALYDSEIIRFESYLPVSRIQSVVDSTDRSIISSSIDPTITIQKETEAGNDFTWTSVFKVPVVEGSVSSNLFTIRDENGVLKSDIGDIGTIDYENGILTVSVPSAYITVDGALMITFTPVDPFIRVQKEYILIDGDDYTWNFIKVAGV